MLSCICTICCAPALPKANMSDHHTTIQTALAARFGEEFSLDPSLSRASKSLPNSPATAPSAAISKSRSHRTAPAHLRLRASAPSKSDLQQCDILVVRDPATRSALRASFPISPNRQSAGISRHPRRWRPAQAHRANARKAIPERSPRPVLQCGRRRRHRACDIPARCRRGRARLLSDQRDPRPRRGGERPAPLA